MHGLTPESQDNLLIGQTNKSLQSGRNPNPNQTFELPHYLQHYANLPEIKDIVFWTATKANFRREPFPNITEWGRSWFLSWGSVGNINFVFVIEQYQLLPVMGNVRSTTFCNSGRFTLRAYKLKIYEKFIEEDTREEWLSKWSSYSIAALERT